MTTVYFIRHAEPARKNPADRLPDEPIYTDATFPLTDKGKADTGLVTAYLRDKGVDVVLSSPFKRAVDTVAPFAREAGLEVEIIDDFRERRIAREDFWVDDFKAYAARQWADFTYKLEDGESLGEVQARKVVAFCNQLKRCAGKTLVIGTHGTALSLLLNHFDTNGKLNVESGNRRETFGNTHAKWEQMTMPWAIKLTFDESQPDPDGTPQCVCIEEINLFVHKPMLTTIFPYNTFAQHAYTVIFARQSVRQDAKHRLTEPSNANANANANANCPAIATTHNPYEWHWLLARHRDRNTWEIPGGRIEPGESPRDCAQRELYEETGVQTQWLDPAFDYCVHNNGVYSVGQVYLADVTISGTDTTATLPAIPPNSEMIETRLFPTLPPADALTYPHIQPVLNKAFQDWLALNTPDEYRDLYDADRNPLGILHRRGTPLLPNTYNTVVRAWLVNDTGQILITQRALTKLGGPGLWEVPTGSATAGETGQLSARRELAEEAGITVPPECGEIFFTQRKDWAFWDNWLFRHNYNLADVVLQAGETINTRAATVEEIREMIKKGTFIPQVADELEHLAVVIKAQ